MATRTRPKIVEPEIETYYICDLCGKEIDAPKHHYTCVMCKRDTHGSTPCSEYDHEQEGIVCRVCWELRTAYAEAQERCNRAADEAFTSWQNRCEERRYDDVKPDDA